MNPLKAAAALSVAALWCSSAGAVPVQMRWDGIATGPGTSATVFFSYEDSIADSNADPLLNRFEGALTSFSAVLGDGTTWTLDASQPTYMSLFRITSGAVSVRLGGTLLSAQSPGVEFNLGTGLEILYSGPYDTLTQLAASGWGGGLETYYRITNEETGNQRLLQSGRFTILPPTSVPEPSSLALLSIGLLGLAARRRKSG